MNYQDYRAELEAMDREIGEIAREIKPIPSPCSKSAIKVKEEGVGVCLEIEVRCQPTRVALH